MRGLLSYSVFRMFFYLMTRLGRSARAAQKWHLTPNRANGRQRRSVLCPLSVAVAIVAAVTLTSAASGQVAPPRKSGLYLTAVDYKNGQLSFAGDCGSKEHKLELHDVLHKSYIHVTHATEKRRFAKSDLFGFRACDGRDYRFASNLEHEILEARELYIYSRDVYVSHGRGRHTVRGYFFSAGAEGPVLALTKENLKKTFPDNQRFHEALDAAFAAKQKLSEYDETQKMFRVNELWIASRG